MKRGRLGAVRFSGAFEGALAPAPGRHLVDRMPRPLKVLTVGEQIEALARLARQVDLNKKVHESRRGRIKQFLFDAIKELRALEVDDTKTPF